MTTWIRDTFTSSDYQVGTQLLASVAAGNTILRVHLTWGMAGDTDVDTDYAAVATNILTMGLVTTVGNGSEAVPNARTASADQVPPTQRWIYWETQGIRPNYIDASVGSVGWVGQASTDPRSTRGQVLATGIPGGDTLNLWASWASPFAWDPSGSAMVWGAASVLLKI
jgi:hypothetical protein